MGTGCGQILFWTAREWSGGLDSLSSHSAMTNKQILFVFIRGKLLSGPPNPLLVANCVLNLTSCGISSVWTRSVRAICVVLFVWSSFFFFFLTLSQESKHCLEKYEFEQGSQCLFSSNATYEAPSVYCWSLEDPGHRYITETHCLNPT